MKGQIKIKFQEIQNEYNLKKWDHNGKKYF